MPVKNEREMVERNGFLKAPEKIYGSDFLSKSVAKHLSDCISLWTRLISILKEEKTIGWWPMDHYHSFKTIVIELDRVLKEKAFVGEG